MPAPWGGGTMDRWPLSVRRPSVRLSVCPVPDAKWQVENGWAKEAAN